MLSIIWGILKVTGMVLLILLGLLLVVLFLILFVPVRYELAASGEYEKEAEDSPEFLVKARVSWLLRFFCLRIRADGNGMGIKIRLFGVPLIRQGKERKEKKNRKRNTKKEKKKVQAVSEESQTASFLEEEPVQRIEEERIETAPAKEAPEELEKKQVSLFEKIRRFFRKISELFRQIGAFFSNFFHNLRCTFEKICDKIKEIFEILGNVRDFLKAEENREAFRYVKGEAGKLLRHIFPQKLSGQIVFGLEDPAATGRVLMVLGMGYPLIGNRLLVTPIFENKKYLKGGIFLKGRIRAFSLLIIVIRVWFNKKFRGLLARGRGLREQRNRT
ncbi:MAG: hypothetical protein HFI63_03905 [Lachnospiraceae bacterium]|nr:hypothetical protein [Lachnospiraceae bacterium]